MTGAPLVVGVDVGGTSVKGLLLDAGGRAARELRVRTPAPDPTGTQVVEAVADVVAQLTARADPDVPVGVVVPGIVDEHRGTAVQSVNIGWRDLPLRELLQTRLDRRVALGHDVRAGAVAEARTGAARGAEGVVAFVAVGTGIAAAVLVDGVPVVAGGWAGEVGQRVLVHGPFAGLRVEQVGSARATAVRAGEPHARAVADRVRAGDAAARAVWQETVDVLADVLVDLVVTVAPSAIVLGGGLALAGDVLLDPLRAALGPRVAGLRAPHLVVAAHGDTAAARGAALLAQDLAVGS
ncbi:ROK family protein [uncultured Modestobacter sp.]|uniref:ROK family protein n=1 Tax=uncultured Modestobacter sp. TaxID=380048 RepID=UPI00262195E3|nr:ROK family protein [uncultured Modestobacter sp.]